MTKQTPITQQPKKPYTPPKLIRHGDVSTMTRSGTASVAEPINSGNGSPQKQKA
jgi:hypothetical protein